jgi:hypothetical protein
MIQVCRDRDEGLASSKGGGEVPKRKQVGYALAFCALGWALAVLYGRYVDSSGPFHQFAITQGLMWVPVLLLLVARSLTREKRTPIAGS